MKTTGYGATDVGKCRSNNEDTFFVDDELGLYIVCDGMGGHDAGEVASAEATRLLHQRLLAKQHELSQLSDSKDMEPVQDIVVKEVKFVSRWIHDEGRVTGHPGMGTTLTALLTVGDRAIVASVGDSRAYHCRKKNVELLTKDHTLAYELFLEGSFSAEEVKTHPFGHYLTRCVGAADDVEVDTVVAHLVPGDTFLLCTDGLTRYFDDEAEIGAHMFGESSTIPRKLIDEANSMGGRDNITVLIIHVAGHTEHTKRRWFTRMAV